MVRLGLEWDESSQKTVCRRGLAKASGVFPFLITRGEVVTLANNGVAMCSAESIYPPVILAGTTVGNIWSGILRAIGTSPFAVAPTSNHLCLG